ncbi:MAG: MATE family efflux transporter [Oscillospiraceae bacterium]|nr:MATE family efflux transporter [Oscillospiraceae bacterium]
MKTTVSLTDGKIFSPLVRFALPVLFALFLQSMYGAVDLIVVGHFGVAADVSAVATGSQVLHTVTIVIMGFSMGLTVIVGRLIGAGKAEEAGIMIGRGIVLFAIIAAAASALLVTLADPIARVMRAPQEAFSRTVDYITICGAGMVFIVAYNLVGSVFRGIGDSRMPLVTVAIACAINIAGDLFFVAVLGLGTAGAAYATVLAQAISVLLSLLIIRRRKLPFAFRLSMIRADGKRFSQIFRLGIPIALQDLLVSLSFLVITAIVNHIGLMESAGVGVASKLTAFVMLVPSAYMQSMSAFVAQNMGAEKPRRARKALLYGILSSLAVGVLMWYLHFFHGDMMASIFARDPNVIAAAAEYLKAYAIDCLLTSFLFCFIGYFNGVGSTVFVMVQGFVGAFCVRLPLAWLASNARPVSLFRVGLSTPASTLTQIILCAVWFWHLLRKERAARLTDAPPQDKIDA